MRRSWGFWLVVWGVRCGTTVGGSHLAQTGRKATVSTFAQIFTIFVVSFIRFFRFPTELFACGVFVHPSNVQDACQTMDLQTLRFPCFTNLREEKPCIKARHCAFEEHTCA